MKTISIIVPLFNEEQGVPILLKRLRAAVDPLPYRWEFVMVDDGSGDATLERLLEAQADEPRLTVVKLSRNWGHQNAYNAGLDHARGQAAIFMDGDMEDPPELIPRLVEAWEQGCEVVYAVKRSRKTSLAKRACFGLFYWMLNKLSSVRMEPQAGMFCLAGERALDMLRQCREKNKYYPGLRAFIGFRQTGVFYDREPRYDNAPRQSLRSLVNLALNAFFSFSFLPIRMLTHFGALMLLLCVLMGGFFLVVRLFHLDLWGLHEVQGWTSLALLLFAVISVLIIFQGVLGEYIARIYDEVRNRPYYIVDAVFSGRGDGPGPEERG